MPKGLHTQTAVVLFETAPTRDDIAHALGDFRIIRPLEGTTRGFTDGWLGGRYGLLIALDEEKNGAAPVHAFDEPWPDTMGDPKTDPALFGAWTMGFLGPFTYPRGLERAVQQSWGWDEAEAVVARHGAFVRINASYVGGTEANAPCIPQGYNPFTELVAITRMAQAIGRMKGALAYFNPNGEVVLPFDQVSESMQYHLGRQLPPLDVWSNVRLFRLEDLAPWTVMDTVGMGQLDVIDLEACFPGDRIQPNEVAAFLRNLGNYLLTKGPVIKHGDTIDGPGAVRWRGLHAEALLSPPRRVIRWFPQGYDPPDGLGQGIGEETK
jgi:Domain of unknown function (DUF4261)